MAAGTLAAPGTKVGPCATKCAHLDCKKTRSMAASRCHFCQEQIGYDTRYYRDTFTDGYVHALCLERDVERQRSVRERIHPVPLFR